MSAPIHDLHASNLLTYVALGLALAALGAAPRAHAGPESSTQVPFGMRPFDERADSRSPREQPADLCRARPRARRRGYRPARARRARVVNSSALRNEAI